MLNKFVFCFIILFSIGCAHKTIKNFSENTFEHKNSVKGLVAKSRAHSFSDSINNFNMGLINKEDVVTFGGDAEKRREYNTKYLNDQISLEKDIIIPEGVFDINSNILFKSKVLFSGLNKSTSILEIYPIHSNILTLYNLEKISINNITFINFGSYAVWSDVDEKYINHSDLRANTSTISISNCSKVTVSDCVFIGGGDGVKCENNSFDINIKNNSFRKQVTSSISVKESYRVRIINNDFMYNANDGLKTRNGSNNLLISGNISSKNGRDGYDFYDGLENSIVTNNIATNNFFQGFDMKGKLDSLRENYSFIKNTFSNNNADNNGQDGFHIVGARYLNMNGNTASNNKKNGFLLSNVQSSVFNGLESTHNKRHGFYIEKSSRSVISNCIANDNFFNNRRDYLDEKGSGFYFGENADGFIINSCRALNSPHIPYSGYQLFGIYFQDDSGNLNNGSNGNEISNCHFKDNRYRTELNDRSEYDENGIGGEYNSQIMK